MTQRRYTALFLTVVGQLQTKTLYKLISGHFCCEVKAKIQDEHSEMRISSMKKKKEEEEHLFNMYRLKREQKMLVILIPH